MKALCDKYKARLYLDEAHGLGVIGKTGRGCEEHYGKGRLADIVMCTFSKSFGSLGGFVAGDVDVIEYIKHFARSLIFSASMPPATIASVGRLPHHHREGARAGAAGCSRSATRWWPASNRWASTSGTAETPIVPLMIGDMEKTLMFWRALFDGGVFANPVLSPAVPPDSTLIRTSYMAIHTDDELDQILEVAGKAGKALGII